MSTSAVSHAFPLLRSNAYILRLPFELWSLADTETFLCLPRLHRFTVFEIQHTYKAFF